MRPAPPVATAREVRAVGIGGAVVQLSARDNSGCRPSNAMTQSKSLTWFMTRPLDRKATESPFTPASLFWRPWRERTVSSRQPALLQDGVGENLVGPGEQARRTLRVDPIGRWGPGPSPAF